MVMQHLENSTYVDGRVTQCWLRDFLDYVDRTTEMAAADNDTATLELLDVSTAEAFAKTWRQVYLADEWSENRLDVAYSAGGQRVIAARFLIQVIHPEIVFLFKIARIIIPKLICTVHLSSVAHNGIVH